ncbi:MAG: aspartate aminotransferase [Archaeoglobi archaeon]|nr:aspartate aminotransferase [Archaeoglobi archaeon]
MFAKRITRVEESATFKIADLAKKLQREGKDVISLSLGEPDFDTPMHIKEAAVKSLMRGDTHYAPAQGIPELREEIARKLREENGLEVTAENILVTPGAKHAIFEVAQTLIDEGDEVILFDPSWVTYDACVKLSGGKTVWVPTDRENGFKPVNLAEYVSDKTKMLILNTPSNPSGAVLGKDELKEIADLAIDHDFYVLSDEIYEKLIYDGEKHISIGSFDGMEDRTITVNGFSKSYAMTGWRIGYLAAPKEIMKGLMKVQSHSVSHPTTFVMYAALEALRQPQDFVEEMRQEFDRRRKLIVEGLRKIGFKTPTPKGAFYVFPYVGEFGTGEEVVERLLRDAYVATTPGSAFGPGNRDYIRISYAASIENIKKALERIEKALKG